MRLPRPIEVLVTGGFALLVAALLLSTLPARAATMGGWRYTDNGAPAPRGRTIALFVDRDFDNYERERIVAAMRQWNYVLNGFVQFRAKTLPDNPTHELLAQIKRSGGWIVARVDSRHPITREGEGMNALAVTAGGQGGFVYVISDRIGQRDLTGVVMHEFGHVLGAGHGGSGLMAPVYSAAMGRCIDRQAVAMVASVHRLPLGRLNWCVGPGENNSTRIPMVRAPSPGTVYRGPMAARP
ncbi:MAG: hypothetical protein KIS73_22330 [Enhydrobacter sp.]|nr:hypothetical protein [Enhydrobacter sp.]